MCATGVATMTVQFSLGEALEESVVHRMCCVNLNVF